MSFVNTLNLNNVDYQNLDTHCQRVPNQDISHLLKTESSKISNNIKILVKQYNSLKKLPSSQQNDVALNELSRKIFEEANLAGNIQFNDIDYWNNPYVYGDGHFWDKSYDYNNQTDASGKAVKFKGVCNTALLDSCNKIKKSDRNEMIGVCLPNEFDNNNEYYTNTSNSKKNYKTFDVPFQQTKYKLPSNSVIPNGVDPKTFSGKYCESGEFLQVKNTFICK
jgi:hypothetical protein